MRTTKSQVKSAFLMLCKAAGKRPAKSWDDVGGWSLDYNAIYGGYVIVEVHNKSGGQDQPFGPARHTATAFYDMCHFARKAVEMSKGGDK